MLKGKRVCKICGKEYDYCQTAPFSGEFRWVDVACCEAHGMQYLHDVLVARGELIEDVELEKKPAKKTKKKQEADEA